MRWTVSTHLESSGVTNTILIHSKTQTNMLGPWMTFIVDIRHRSTTHLRLNLGAQCTTVLREVARGATTLFHARRSPAMHEETVDFGICWLTALD